MTSFAECPRTVDAQCLYSRQPKGMKTSPIADVQQESSGPAPDHPRCRSAKIPLLFKGAGFQCVEKVFSPR